MSYCEGKLVSECFAFRLELEPIPNSNKRGLEVIVKFRTLCWAVRDGEWYGEDG